MRPIANFWRSESFWVAPGLLVALALLLILPNLAGGVRWLSDSRYYQAQVYEIQGDSQATALHRSFAVTLAHRRRLRPAATTASSEFVQHPLRWIQRAASFYRRRWLVPLLAAAIYPLAGQRALLDVSLLGYLLIGPLLYALLRRRFSSNVSVVAAAMTLLLPPLHIWAGYPLTDSWGVTVEILTVLAGLTALEQGGKHYVGFAGAMLLLSLTHDGTIVIVVSLAVAAAVRRELRGFAMLATAVAASVPAPLLFGGSLRQELSAVTSGYHTLTASWGYIARQYPHAVWRLLSQDVRWPGVMSYSLFWYCAGLFVVGSVIYLVTRASNRDTFFLLAKALIIGGAVSLLLVPNYTELRLELVFVPTVAVSFGLVLSRLVLHPRLSHYGARMRVRLLPETREPEPTRESTYAVAGDLALASTRAIHPGPI